MISQAGCCHLGFGTGAITSPVLHCLVNLRGSASERRWRRRHDTPHDARAALLARMEALPIPRTMPLLCGRLLPLHRLLAEGPGPEEQRQEGTPPPLPALDSISLSSQEIDTGTVRRTRARLSDCLGEQ